MSAGVLYSKQIFRFETEAVQQTLVSHDQRAGDGNSSFVSSSVALASMSQGPVMLNQSSKALFVVDPYKPLATHDSVRSNEEQKEPLCINESATFRRQLKQYNRETLETLVSEESRQGVSSFTTLKEKMLRLNQSH